jgi:hypothetical protein
MFLVDNMSDKVSSMGVSYSFGDLSVSMSLGMLDNGVMLGSADSSLSLSDGFLDQFFGVSVESFGVVDFNSGSLQSTMSKLCLLKSFFNLFGSLGYRFLFFGFHDRSFGSFDHFLGNLLSFVSDLFHNVSLFVGTDSSVLGVLGFLVEVSHFSGFVVVDSVFFNVVQLLDKLVLSSTMGVVVSSLDISANDSLGVSFDGISGVFLSELANTQLCVLHSLSGSIFGSLNFGSSLGSEPVGNHDSLSSSLGLVVSLGTLAVVAGSSFGRNVSVGTSSDEGQHEGLRNGMHLYVYL